MSQLQFSTGDLLFSETDYPFIEHLSIIEGIDPISMDYWVAENQIGIGVRRILFKDWIKNRSLKRVKKMNLNFHQKENLMKRINSLIGREYVLAFYNCEHFISEVLFGRLESPQLRKAITSIILVGLLVNLGNSKAA